MGGKSRKSGGVSKQLIAHIKSGRLPASKSKKKTQVPDEKNKTRTLFDEGE
jgi:hypothetical protein